MKYLKPTITYLGNYGSVYECTGREEYENYFQSIKLKYPKQLVKFYSKIYCEHCGENRLHDFKIDELTVHCNKNVNNIKLSLSGLWDEKNKRKVEKTIEFVNVKKFRVSEPNNQNKELLGDILTCELGINESNLFSFEIFTSTQSEIYIEYKNAKVIKKN